MRFVAVLLIVCCPLIAQRARRVPNTSKPTGLYGQPAVTFRGKLLELSKSEIVIETPEQQKLTIRRTRKTKFLKDEKEIKPADIPMGAALTIDVTKDPDLNLQAVNVMVDQPKQ